MKPLLSSAEKERIAIAVSEAESQTSGEIVTAIIPQSDDYAFRELLWAVVTGVLLLAVMAINSQAIFSVLKRVLWLPNETVLVLLIGGLALLGGGMAYFIFQIPFLDRLVAGRKKMAQSVRNRALRHFVEAGVHQTQEGSGVLLFVSVLERRVELIADKGISSRVEPENWQGIITAMIKDIRLGKTANAIEKAVREIGTILAMHMPRAENDENELSDSTAELESRS